MDDINSNKVALVTGGSRGLGKDIALSLARDGNGVIITYHSKAEDAARVVEEIRALGMKAAALQLDVGQLSTSTHSSRSSGRF